MFTRGLCLLRPCFTGVSVWNPSGSTCASICLEVTDVSQLPDPPDGCEFAEVRTISLSDYYLALFQWDGASWVQLVRVTGSFNAGEIDDVDYNLSGTWTATLNGNAVSGAGTYNFAPAVSELDVVFIDGACSYAMEPAVSTPVPLLTVLMNDTTLLPFDPTVAGNWDGFAGNTMFTDVIVTGTTQVELFGFVLTNEVFSDSLGILQFGSNVLLITDHQGFITEIADQTFFVSSILGVNFPALQIVGNEAFATCPSFSGCGSAIITTIGQGAFSGSNMSEGTHLLCTSVGAQAFSATGCATLEFPLLETIDASTFDQMQSLTSADFPACLVIGGNAFAACPLLNSVNFPLCHTIEDNAFDCAALGSMNALSSASFPEVLICGTSAFRKTGLTTISLPKCTSWSDAAGLSYIFRDCTNLVEVIAPLLTSMGDSSDNSCFLNISGNTIDLTVNAVLLTNNGGNPDGDIQYLQANNTVNIL